MNDVEIDLRNVGLKRWRKRALDRIKWASVVREARVKLKGL
jgi:ABC-type molybdenum transport system ATPase subunit/photorepair protein PhrA